GYAVSEPHVLNASWFGVPQDRRRVFVLAARGDQTLPNPPSATVAPVAKRPGGALKLAVDLPVGPTVWDAIGDLPDLDQFELLNGSELGVLEPDVHERSQVSPSEYARRLRGLATDPDDLAYRRNVEPRLLTASMRTAHTPLSIQRFRDTVPGETE